MVCNHEDITYEFTRQDNLCKIVVFDNSYSDTKLELPLYYYKGYTAVDRNTGRRMKVSSSENKLVEVSLEDGMRYADLEVWYAGTVIQSFGDWISGLTLLAVILYLAVNRLKKRG